MRALTAVAGAVAIVAGGALAVQLTRKSGGGDGSPAGPDVPSSEPAPPSATAPTIESVDVEPVSIDEGAWVELVASASDQDGGALVYAWDFGDGADTEGPDLYSVRHQYRDGAEGGTVNTATVRVANPAGESARRTFRARVRNVAPEIRSMDRDGRALVGESVSFQGGAFDPGLDDQLTFRWDFGDGSEAQGASASHVFREDGPHTVTLEVTDGDGGRDQRTMTLNVGQGYRYTVSGDVSAQQDGRVSVYGIPGSPDSDNAILRQGYCVLTLFFNPAGGASDVQDAGSGFGITASLRGGLRAGVFPFGPDRSIRVQRDEGQNPDVFFASLTTARQAPEEIANDFGSESGTITIDHVDDGWIEGSFIVAMPESPPLEYPPRIRMANVEGSFSAQLEQQRGTEDFYACTAPSTFTVERRTPAADAVNVDPQDPAIEVQFSDPVDRSSLSTRTFRLDYRLPERAGETYRVIDGGFSFVDDRTVRFAPSTTLPDGALLCLRLRGGEGGIRGSEGEVLETSRPPAGDGGLPEIQASEGATRAAFIRPRTRRACQAGGRPWEDAVEWGFGTMVELRNVRTELYQVARIEGDTISLVPHKATVARVYPEWDLQTDVHPDVQVLRFPARVWVEADGRRIYPARDGVELRRQDLYDEDDELHARSSVNFFGWKPREGGPIDVRAHVEPSDQTRDPPRVFDGPPNAVPRWEYHPGLVFDYYFLRIGTWADGVPEATRVAGRILAKRSEIYTTQMFPVIGTVGRRGGDFNVGRYRNLQFANALDYVRIVTDQVAPYTDANELVAFAPPEYEGGGTTWVEPLVVAAAEPNAKPSEQARPFRTITMNPRGDIYRTTALTHEFGHSFWLQHVPFVLSAAERTVECSGDRGRMSGIEGFRVWPSGTGGAHKSSLYGNEESTRRLYPLMYPCTQLATESFIMNRHYAALQEEMGTAIRLGFFTGRAMAAADPPTRGAWAAVPVTRAGILPWPTVAAGTAATVIRPATQASSSAPMLLVSGLLPGSGGGNASQPPILFPVRAVQGTGLSGSSPSEGPYRVRALDEDGAELAGADFGVQENQDSDADAPSYFSVALPGSEPPHEVVIERAGRRLVHRTISASPPVVSITAPQPGSTQREPFTLRWQGQDADGDTLDYTVLYSPSGNRPWRAVGVFLQEQEMTLDPALLAPGPAPTLEVVANDGLQEARATVQLELETPLTVLATLPAAGDTADTDVQPIVFFGSDLDPSAVEGALELRTANGVPVPANIQFDALGRRAVILPLEPLEGGATYTLSVARGLEDRYGSRLARELAVPFSVAPEPVAAGDSGAASTTTASEAAAEGPSEEEGDALGYGGVRWVSLRVADHDDLSFSGSGVDGTAGMNLFCTPASQASISLFDAPQQGAATLAVNVTTNDIVEPGATGSYELELLRLILPARGQVYEGAGTLEITRHDAPDERNERRLSGRIRGARLLGESGDRITLDLDFDVNGSCRVR